MGRVDWSEDLLAMLGSVADSEIARLIGCHRKTVSYKRECLGIPASHSRKNNRPPPSMGGWNKIQLQAHVVERLGVLPDYILADEAKVSKGVIARRRREKGIHSFAQQTGKDGRIQMGEPHRRWKV